MKDKEVIRQFVKSDLMRGKKVSDLEVTDNLIETGVIDSLGIQILVSFLEKNFPISIADEDLIPDNFETIDAIWAFVTRGEQ